MHTSSVSRPALAALLALVCVLVYRVCFQDWVYGDGPQLIDTYLFGHTLWMHVLYIPLARMIGFVLPYADLLAGLRWLSILGGALGVAGTFLILCAFVVRPARAMLVSILVATTPALWFFSTTIEVHAPHFAAVALGAALLATWSRGRTALAMACAFTAPLLYLTHKSGVLLAPGWLALGLRAWQRGHEGGASGLPRRGVVTLGLAIALGYGIGLLAGRSLLPAGNSIDSTLAFIQHFRQGPSSVFWSEAVVLGLGALLPLAAWGLRGIPRNDAWVLGSLLLPSIAFFAWYGEGNRGGYFLPIVPFLAVLAERALPRGRAFGVVFLGLLALQLSLSLHVVSLHTQRFSAEERQERVAAVREVLGEHGTLVSLEPTHQPITLDLVGVRELNKRPEFMGGAIEGRSPDQLAHETVEYLRAVMRTSQGPVALDLGLRRKGIARFEPYLDALERALGREFGPVSHRDSKFPLLRLR